MVLTLYKEKIVADVESQRSGGNKMAATALPV